MAEPPGASGAPCELLPWDSEHFGVRIARLAGDVLTAELADAADAWCAEQRIDCLQLLARPDDAATGRLAAERGFQLTDVRVGYERALGGADDALPPPPADAEVREATAADVPALRELAGRSHRTGRFHYDTRFDPERCDELYRRWIERDVEGEGWSVLVAEDAGGLLGYFSSRMPHAGSERTTTSLAAVAERGRGRRIGVGLFAASLAELRAAGARHVTAYANARNLAALRLHPSAGFAAGSVGLWYHRWYLAG